MTSGRRSKQTRRVWRGSGIIVPVVDRVHVPLPEPAGDGQHMWAAVAMWRVSDPTSDAFLLDHENLLTVEGPGCLYCEQPYTPELAAQPCTPVPS